MSGIDAIKRKKEARKERDATEFDSELELREAEMNVDSEGNAIGSAIFVAADEFRELGIDPAERELIQPVIRDGAIYFR